MISNTEKDYDKEIIVFRGLSVSIRQLMIFGWATADVDVIEALARYAIDKGDVYIMETVAKMRNVTVNKGSLPFSIDLDTEIQPGEERFKYVDPRLNEAQAWRVHFVIKRLVKFLPMIDISRYLWKMEFIDQEVYLPGEPKKAYDELVLMGMPDGKKYSLVTYTKYHKKEKPVDYTK